MTYPKQLLTERDTIQKIINEHYDPSDRGGRIKWSEAFDRDDTLKRRLFPRGRTQKAGYTLLSQVTKRWIRNGTLTLPANGSTPTATNGASTGKIDFTPHVDLLKQIAAEYRTPTGRVPWGRALKEHPEWAQQLGYSEAKPESSFFSSLVWWAKKNLNPPTAPRDTGGDASELNFCPRCACNLKAVRVALNLAERV